MRIVEWRPPLFEDRAAGGRALASALDGLGLEQPVVVGVARGGVAVAAELARAPAAPLTAIDVERVNAGRARLGATTAAGPPYLLVEREPRDDEVEAALERAQRLAAALDARLDAAPIELSGRSVVVADDGAVTGLTLAAALRWAAAAEPARLVAATPVAHRAALARLAGEADDVVCPHALDDLTVVGQAYAMFEPLDEWYVAALLAGTAR